MSTAIDEHLAAATAALRGLPTDHNRAELVARVMLAERQGWTCPRCGKPILPEDIGTSRTHKDHVIPISAGGPHLDWNIELLHDRCNLSKHTRMTRRAYALAVEHNFPVPAAEPGALYRAIVGVMDSLRVLDNALEDLDAAGALVTSRDWAVAMPYMSDALAQASAAARVIAARAAGEQAPLPRPAEPTATAEQDWPERSPF